MGVPVSRNKAAKIAATPPPKKGAKPVKRTKAQLEAARKAALGAEEAEAKKEAQTRAEASAARLAQISNLLIAGKSLDEIALSIGASVAELETLLNSDANRYIRSQPALRVFVRRWISEKYNAMIEADWPIAIDPHHSDKLDNQDRVMRMLKELGNLHGAPAPTQTEVKVEAAPETVDALVQAISATQGMGYDASIFDVVEAEVVSEAHEQASADLAEAEAAVGDDQEGDPDDGSF